MLSPQKGGLLVLGSLVGLRSAVVCVLMDIPESILEGVQGVVNPDDPNPPPPPSDVPTFRIEYWNSGGKLVFGKGSVFTLGVMGVVAALVMCCAISISPPSLVSGTLSVVELVLVLVSSESLTEPLPNCLTRAFLSSPHFFNTGSRYFFKWSPKKITTS